MLGILLTKWTIRLSLLGYAAYLICSLSSPARHRLAALRWLWTIAGGLFVLHVICAFHFYHRWSHAHTWQTTADETRQLIGVAFGDGIYFSYLFLALWVADIAWLWLAGSPSERFAFSAITVPRPTNGYLQTPLWRLLVHIYLFFIAFHGAIVFESGPVRTGGIVVCCILGVLTALKWHTATKQGKSACEMCHDGSRAIKSRPKTSPELSLADTPASKM